MIEPVAFEARYPAAIGFAGRRVTGGVEAALKPAIDGILSHLQ